MTHQELRDLLQEQVADLTTTDLSSTAWRSATRIRRRRRGAAAGGVAALVLAVAGVAVVVDDLADPHSDSGPASPAPAPATSDAATGSPAAVRVAGYRGARVWEAPAADTELDLPPRSEPSLPGVVDLRTAGSTPERAPVRALFTEDWRAFALSDTGSLSEVDISRLDKVADEGGNRLNPVSADSLSPDGTRAFFVQDSSLEVLDFTTGRWRTLDTPDWLAEGARWVSPDEIWVPAELGGDAGTVHRLDGTAEPGDVLPQQAWSGEEPWGPAVTRGDRIAQDMFLAGPVSGTGVSNPEAVVVRTGSRVDVLTLWPDSSAPRVKGCCDVLGFLDDDTVMFASKSTEGYRLLAWQVGTEHVYLVSRLAGPGAMIDWLPST